MKQTNTPEHPSSFPPLTTSLTPISLAALSHPTALPWSDHPPEHSRHSPSLSPFSDLSPTPLPVPSPIPSPTPLPIPYASLHASLQPVPSIPCRLYTHTLIGNHSALSLGAHLCRLSPTNLPAPSAAPSLPLTILPRSPLPSFPSSPLPLSQPLAAHSALSIGLSHRLALTTLTGLSRGPIMLLSLLACIATTVTPSGVTLDSEGQAIGEGRPVKCRGVAPPHPSPGSRSRSHSGTR
ncbi:unnamed protein product [Closterium sp. Naga37s-1]|nr:unnamed protein product [Closterium sp. Naga37s-1]